jgi:hypothetical protein
MSFFGSVKSFFEGVGKTLEKLFGAGASTFEVKAQAVITYVAPLVTTIVQLTAGTAAATLVSNIMKTVQVDLATVATAVQAGTAAPGSHTYVVVTTALNSITSNLASLLAAAEVKNSGKVSEITAAVNLIVGEVEAVLSSLAASNAPAPAVPAASAPIAAPAK